jgi:iron complex transport system permease protein
MRFLIITIGLILAVMLALILNLSLGSSKIPFDEVIHILTGQSNQREIWKTIVLEFRLPRALTACLAGAALSLSGLLMQTLFRNPLAGPGVLGVSSGAGLGVALILLGNIKFNLWNSTFIGSWGIATAAFCGSFTVLGLVIFISQKVKSAVSLLIIGLMMGYLASAIVNLLTYFSSAEQIRNYAFWSMGSFADCSWPQLQVMTTCCIVSLLISIWCLHALDALLMGENYAHSMGVKVQSTRILMICSAALAAGSVTAFCGPIAFLGLAVPHLGRRVLGHTQHAQLIPTTILIGISIALIADLIAKLPGSDQTMPLNTITALIGAPIVIALVLKRQGWSY